MGKYAGMNKYQKACFRPGEKRLGRDELPQMLKMAASDDAEDRLVAAEHLCPCHLRRRVDEAWEALYRMLEDPDVRVQTAAWHTLTDGGKPDDPKLDEIFERVLDSKPDQTVLNFAQALMGPRVQRQKMMDKVAVLSAFSQRGKCDFCGKVAAAVTTDYDIEIPTGDGGRPALVCQACHSAR